MGRHCNDCAVPGDDFCVSGNGICGHTRWFKRLDSDFCSSVLRIFDGNLRKSCKEVQYEVAGKLRAADQYVRSDDFCCVYHTADRRLIVWERMEEHMRI